MSESRFADEATLAHLAELEAENAKLREELAAVQFDTARLDLVEANPTWLRYHKKHWEFVNPSTNYEYSVFRTVRDAIDEAMKENE